MSGAQTSSFYPVNQLLVDNAQQIQNQYAPQRNELLIQRSQQEIGGTEIEYAARAAQGLLGLGDEAAMAAAYPGAVASAQQYGFLKNAPSVFPGKARLEQIAAMGTSSEKQYEQRGNLAGNAALLNGITGTTPPTATPGTTTGTVAPAGDIEVPAQQRARLVYDGMIKRGADHATAAAWAANALHESAANPSTGPGDQGASQGLFMWNGPRLQAYQAKYGHGPQGAPLDEQLDFVTHELGGTEAAAAARIAQAPPADKAAAISREFLRPKDREGEQQRRSATAQQLNTLWQPQQAVTAPGGGRVQVASATPTTATDAVPAPPGATPAAPAAAPAATTGGYTPQQKAALAALAADPKTQRSQLVAAMAKYDDDNRANAAAARVESHQAQTLQQSKDAAAALAEQRRLENARANVPTGMQRNAETGALEPMPGYRGATADERINYALKNDQPDSQEYADAWKAKKWQIAPGSGNVIENDMSGYPPPTRSVQRPTYLPAPTSKALDDVRQADTDARVIVPSIDRYVDLHKGIGGSSWGAFFDNPRDPKAQQLIGAFNAMKTVLRSPTYANTGVLQPAEMEMLKQELVSPQTIRGLYATPQALEARLHEIKFAILSRQDAELRSVGRDGVIVRDKSDYGKIPDGGKYYDEDGNLKVKRKAE